jgi:uncharacterized membrane protein
MSTLFLFILAILGLVVGGLFLPVLWIVAVVLLVVGLIYMWQLARASAARAREE